MEQSGTVPNFTWHCAFGCNLKRCKGTGRHTKFINVTAKNPRKTAGKKICGFGLEEIRQLVFHHSSFIRGRVHGWKRYMYYTLLFRIRQFVYGTVLLPEPEPANLQHSKLSPKISQPFFPCLNRFEPVLQEPDQWFWFTIPRIRIFDNHFRLRERDASC
jgi:hypothetical protein